MTADLDTHAPAYEPSFKYHDENFAMLKVYADLLIRGFKRAGAKRILGFGVGHEVVVRRIAEYAREHDAVYTVLEGSKAIIDRLLAQGGTVCSPHVKVEHTYFEDYSPSLPFDAIECGFVLEHVNDPGVILQRYAPALAPGGTLYVAVPNARSLHRRLGHAAGLLPDLFKLSAHDLELGHRRYFDLIGLRDLLSTHGFTTIEEHGLLLKPFTTDQLQQMKLSPAVHEALLKVGLEYPDSANAIYVECSLSSDGAA